MSRGADERTRRTRSSQICRRGLLGDQSGLVAGAEALIFGVLVFVIGTIIIVNAWSVIDARFATAAAARQAVRGAVEAPVGADLDVAAEVAGADAFAGYGRDPAEVEVVWDGSGAAPVQARCAPVRYRASTTVGMMVIPRFANVLSVDVSSVASELIDPYRSGLEDGDCDV